MTHQCGSCSDAGCTGLCRGDALWTPAPEALREAAATLLARVRWRRAFERDLPCSPATVAMTDRLEGVMRWLQATADNG